MSTPQFLITSYLESCQGDLEQLRKNLFEKGVFTKDYQEQGLMLLYHKYDSPVTSDLERECRSLIIDRNTLKIVSYSCETPRLNKEGMEFLIANSTQPQIINKCYEGTYLLVFNHNDKWYVSTRRCLDSKDSMFTNQNLSHYDMFGEILSQGGYNTVDDFTSKLDKTHVYSFILIHHQNKHIIDYSKQFGENYAKICLTSIRDSSMRELDICDNKVEFASYDVSGTIFVPEKYADLEEFSQRNKDIKYDATPDDEGIVVRVWSENLQKYHLIKLQTTSYQFSLVMGQERNIFKGLIYLYQNGKLLEYFQQNPATQSIKKIVNPLNTAESYDTIGTVDAVFKVCTSECFELFKNLWSIKTGKHQNKELYDILPKEYKDVMFAIRGMYFKKKALLHSFDKESVTPDQIKSTHVKVSDVYNFFKSMSTDNFVAFLRMRKLMFNWVKNSTDKNLKDFGTISSHCDKVHVKLCAIFTNKLYPNIMPNDLPPQKDVQEVLHDGN